MKVTRPAHQPTPGLAEAHLGLLLSFQRCPSCLASQLAHSTNMSTYFWRMLDMMEYTQTAEHSAVRSTHLAIRITYLIYSYIYLYFVHAPRDGCCSYAISYRHLRVHAILSQGRPPLLLSVAPSLFQARCQVLFSLASEFLLVSSPSGGTRGSCTPYLIGGY